MMENYTLNHKLMVSFRNQGTTTESPLWYDTALVDYEIAEYMPEMFANCASMWMRGNTSVYQCDVT